MDEKEKFKKEISELEAKKEVEELKKKRDKLAGKRSVLEMIGLIMFCIIVFILCFSFTGGGRALLEILFIK